MNSYFIHGHRGARGVYPENTIVGFLETYNDGIRAFELDVVISKDLKVVISHESWMNSLFCTTPEGNKISIDNEKEFNLFEMDYTQIKKYDCGLLQNPNFNLQKNFAAYKPLLSDLDQVFNAQMAQDILWNIELKTEEGTHYKYHPESELFVDLVIDQIQKSGCFKNVMLQSFDTQILEALHRKNLGIPISYLVENTHSLAQNLSKISFIPQFYNPDFTLVDQFLVNEVHQLGIKIVPWTVNNIEDAMRLVSFGVDGLISDFPQRLSQKFCF